MRKIIPRRYTITRCCTIAQPLWTMVRCFLWFIRVDGFFFTALFEGLCIALESWYIKCEHVSPLPSHIRKRQDLSFNQRFSLFQMRWTNGAICFAFGSAAKYAFLNDYVYLFAFTFLRVCFCFLATWQSSSLKISIFFICQTSSFLFSFFVNDHVSLVASQTIAAVFCWALRNRSTPRSFFAWDLRTEMGEQADVGGLSATISQVTSKFCYSLSNPSLHLKRAIFDMDLSYAFWGTDAQPH